MDLATNAGDPIACYSRLNGRKAHLPANVELVVYGYQLAEIRSAIRSRSEQRVVAGYFEAYRTVFSRELVAILSPLAQLARTQSATLKGRHIDWCLNTARRAGQDGLDEVFEWFRRIGREPSAWRPFSENEPDRLCKLVAMALGEMPYDSETSHEWLEGEESDECMSGLICPFIDAIDADLKFELGNIALMELNHEEHTASAPKETLEIDAVALAEDLRSVSIEGKDYELSK